MTKPFSRLHAALEVAAMVTETNRIEYAARLAMVDLGAEPTLPSSGVHWTSKTVISAFLAAVGLLLIEVFSPVDFDKTR